MPLLSSPPRPAAPARPGWTARLAQAAPLARAGRLTQVARLAWAAGRASPAGRAVLPWLPAAGFLASAVFAALVALASDEPVHRLWGVWAAAGYGLAALIASSGPARAARSRSAVERAVRRSDGAAWSAAPSPAAAGQAADGPGGGVWAAWSLAAAVAVALAGAVLVPLGVLAAAGRGMPEVGVTERAAALLLQHGSPYLTAAGLAGHGFLAYNPYLPAMTVFGLPHAVAGPGLLTDPRLWAGLTFAAASLAAFRVAGLPGRASAGATAVLVATPVIAFPLVVSGNDVPVLGLATLGLALAGASHHPAKHPDFTSATAARLRRIFTPAVAAGVVLGLAAAMKATAWPALAVAGALLASRAGWPEARRAAARPAQARQAVARQAVARFAAAAAVVFAAALLPWLITAPGALLRNTVLFPLGLTGTPSPAASPLPGHLLAAAGPAGHAIALAALAAAALVPAVFLVLRPPRTGAAAVRRLAGWLALLFALAPDSRWGYFCYPAGLAAWLWLRSALRPPAAGSGQRGEKVADGLAAAGVEGDLHPGVPAGLRRA